MPAIARSRELLTAAVSYAVVGWPVIPLHTPRAGRCSCGHRACSSPGKHPRTKRGMTDASTDPHLIAGWWRRWPGATSVCAPASS